MSAWIAGRDDNWTCLAPRTVTPVVRNAPGLSPVNWWKHCPDGPNDPAMSSSPGAIMVSTVVLEVVVAEVVGGGWLVVLPVRFKTRNRKVAAQ
jgi:hypothetical protein